MKIPLSSQVAGWLVTISTFTAGVGTFLLTANEAPWGLDAHNIGLTLSWIGVISNLAVVALRRDAVPGITSGVGTEGGK